MLSVDYQGCCDVLTGCIVASPCKPALRRYMSIRSLIRGVQHVADVIRLKVSHSR